MKREQMKVLLSMYGGYIAFMLCRNTLITSSAAMIQDPSLGLDVASYGQLMSLHSAGSILGKLVTGIGADLLGGRRMFLIALSLTGLANLAFGMVSSLFLFGVLNFTGQFFKAGGWPSMAKIIGVWYPQKKHGRIWSIISTSSRVGTILAVLGLGYLLEWVSWRVVFFISAALTAGAVIFVFYWLKERPKEIGLESAPVESKQQDSKVHPFDQLNVSGAVWAFFRNIRFWLICFSLAFLTILMDFINFIPIYLSETMNITASQAAMAGSTFPGGMFLALIATSFLYDRFSKFQLIWVMAVLLSLSCLCAFLLWSLPALALGAEVRFYVALLAIFVLGFTISPAYYIPMSVFSINFGGKHSGFLIALIDVFGYAGAFIFNFFGGSIAQNYGWSVFLLGLVSIAVLALVTTTAFLSLDCRAQAKVAS